MRLIITIVVTTLFVTSGMFGQADERLARIESDIMHIRENQRRIEAILEKNSKILYGNGKEGMVTVIRLNTEHRSMAEKFAWLVIGAIVANAGTIIFIVIKMSRKSSSNL